MCVHVCVCICMCARVCMCVHACSQGAARPQQSQPGALEATPAPGAMLLTRSPESSHTRIARPPGHEEPGLETGSEQEQGRAGSAPRPLRPRPGASDPGAPGPGPAGRPRAHPGHVVGAQRGWRL